MDDNNKVKKSLGWSFLGELMSKIISPITNLILARILLPSDYGVVAVCNMVVSFIDIITDAGFGKFIVQYEFENYREQKKFLNVAFFSNLAVSLVLWVIIILCSEKIALWLGNVLYANIIPIACIQLIFTSMSSIQMSLLRRNFEFKKLFFVRIVVSIIPLFFTLPLAITYKNYWALIIGNIVGALFNSCALWYVSNWTPKIEFSINYLNKMLNFSIWSVFEALAHWTIFWIDTFIVSNHFSVYYLGLYKNCSNMIFSLLSMLCAAFSPVLFSTLSRQHNDNIFMETFLYFEKMILYILLPVSITIFFYKDFMTYILFGAKWLEGADIVGSWALMMGLSILIYNFPAEAIKSKGKPKILFLYQVCYLCILVPACIYAANFGFWDFVYTRTSLILFQLILFFLLIKFFFKWNIRDFIVFTIKPIVCCIPVFVLCIVYKSCNIDFLCQLFQILSLVVIYMVTLWAYCRNDLYEYLNISGQN